MEEGLHHKFAYEVAFSFCSRDEALATELDDLLGPRFATFIYHRKQEAIAGTDGEKTFNEVFMQKTRVAVILYRPEWGTTPFTRIEETAIRNRAYKEGYDFTLWIALEEGLKLPPYVERTRIYYGLPQYGVASAAGVIEQCIQRQGGNTRPETFEEKAQRLRRKTEAHERRRAFLSSNQAPIEAGAMGRKLLQLVAERADNVPGWKFHVQSDVKDGQIDNWVEVYASNSVVLLVKFHQPSWNTLEKSQVAVQVWDGPPPQPGRYYVDGDEPPRRRSDSFVFDQTLSGENVWMRAGRSEYLTQSQMVDHCLGMLIEEAERAASRKGR